MISDGKTGAMGFLDDYLGDYYATSKSTSATLREICTIALMMFIIYPNRLGTLSGSLSETILVYIAGH